MVAISIAPFLFPKSYTTKVLQKIIQDLYGPNQLGLKTLSQNDMAYRPRYINQDNIGDASVNNGQNYHNVFEVVLLCWFFTRVPSGSGLWVICSKPWRISLQRMRNRSLLLFFSCYKYFDSDLMLLERSTSTVSLSLKQTTLHPTFGILFQNWLKRMVFLFIFILWTPS